VDTTEVVEPAGDEDFVAFAERVGGRLLRALTAVFGPDIGREAALDALAWGWLNWARLIRIGNPAGYLYRVGLNAGRREARRRDRDLLSADVGDRASQEDHAGDPDLRKAVQQLSPRQRAAVVMVIGHRVPLREAAETLGCSVSSLRNHVNRALRKLRAELGDDDEDR
jgi:RNA polymerase sigma-70 factor (ECF subfamily)